MKKTFFSSVMLCLMAAFLVGCASTPKEPRSIKSNSSKINSVKTAKEIAENYDLEKIFHLDSKDSSISDKQALKIGNLETNDIYIAADAEKKEKIAYLLLKNPQTPKTNNIQFSYLELNEEKTSTIKFFTEEGAFILNNTSKECDFESFTHELSGDGYKPVTKTMAENREVIKSILSLYFGLTFDEEINAEQAKIIESKN